VSEYKVKISGISMYVPERVLTNADLEKIVDTTNEWILERTGIHERHIVEKGQATSDLAAQAILRLCSARGIEPADIDLIIIPTVTPDMFFPSTACVVQEKIGAKNAWGFDLSGACSGFIFALAVGEKFVRTGVHRRVVVVGAETMSSIVDYTDRATCVLFGDGAGAAVLEVTTEPDRGILGSYLRADGTGSGFLWAGGGLRVPPPNPEPRQAHMQGRPVFNFAVKAMAEVVLHLLETLQIAPEEVRYVVPHQANIRILQAAQKRIPIAPDRFVVTIDEVANTSAASIPLALAELDRQGRLAPGDVVLTTGFGAGLTYGGNAIRW